MSRTDPRPNYGSKRRELATGYVDVYAPDHPLARSNGYVFEHRKVAWDAGILTDPTDQVHHRNHDRSDNRPENLEAKSGRAHSIDHAEERGMVANQYGLFLVKPPEERASALYPSAGAVRSERPCRGCDGAIPPSMRRDAKFCSVACRNRWHKRRAA